MVSDKCLGLIRIPRWLKTDSLEQVQIHGFSDASKKAYGAVIYVRTIEPSGKVHTNLLIAKSRIAPLDEVTIPRLELMAADLLSRLLKVVQSAMEYENVPYFLWCDSTIALQWINKPIHTRFEALCCK